MKELSRIEYTPFNDIQLPPIVEKINELIACVNLLNNYPLYKLIDFIKYEGNKEPLFINKYYTNICFGRFPNEDSYYIPMCDIEFNTKEEVINHLNKNL